MIRSFCLTLASLLALSAPASAQTVLRLNGWLPATHPIMTRTLKPWAEEVNKVTQGRVRIEVTASSMGPPPTQVDMVRDNVVDMVFSVHGYTPQRFVLARVGEFLSCQTCLSPCRWHCGA